MPLGSGAMKDSGRDHGRSAASPSENRAGRGRREAEYPGGTGPTEDAAQRRFAAGWVVLRSWSRRLGARRLAVGLLTGSLGRFVAFVIDVGEASAVYWSRRLRGKETPW